MVEEKKDKYKQLVARDYTEDEFRDMWRSIYCRKVIRTFDGIRVKFYDSNFDHAFYESSDRHHSNKEVLSYRRLARILWIKDAIEDPNAEIHVGYTKNSKQGQKRRVTLVKENYLVVIQLYKDNEANFITAFVGDEETIMKVKADPFWPGTKKDAD